MYASTSPSYTRPDPFVVASDILDPPPWQPEDRPELEPHQVPPTERFSLWLLEGGRGSGKTEACARYFAAYFRANPGHRGRIIAPTMGDAVEACVMGPSGLKAMDPQVRWMPSAPGGAKVAWPNGSEALVLGTPTPRDVDRLRAGGNRHLDWWEEMAANPQLGNPEDEQGAWNQAQLGLRLGSHPHSIASTTPRPRRAYLSIRKLVGTILRRGTVFDNPHLPREFVERMRERYEGTRLGRQELLGEVLEDIEGALVRREWIEKARRHQEPLKGYRVKVLGLDPADGLEAGDEQAWTLMGIGLDHEVYVIQSVGMRDRPAEWLRAAVQVALDEDAMIVIEKNHGGEFLVGLLEKVMAEMEVRVPYAIETASKGKVTRAEPLALLYEQGRIHHLDQFVELEDQLCSYTGAPGEKSPDRLDSAAWAHHRLSRYKLGPETPGADKAIPYGAPEAQGAVAWR